MAGLEQYLNNPNVRKILDLLAYTEGTQGNGYATAFGGGALGNLAKHPNTSASFTQTNGKSNTTTAAGRYQFLSNTWNNLARQYGLRDFSPRNQDLGAIALLQQNGALPYILKGDYRTAIQKSGGTWASLPSANSPQPRKSWQEVQSFLGGNQSAAAKAALARQLIFGGRDFNVTSPFGYRGNIGVKGASTNHNGIDLAAPHSTPIYAPDDGVLGGNQTPKGGNQLWVNGASGYRFGFAHLDRYAVQPGTRVKKGQLIGYTGNTGIGTGAHLHFTVTNKRGQKIDPSNFMFDGGQAAPQGIGRFNVADLMKQSAQKPPPLGKFNVADLMKQAPQQLGQFKVSDLQAQPPVQSQQGIGKFNVADLMKGGG